MEASNFNTDLGILLLGGVGLLWILANNFVLNSFRKSLKMEQLVGVKFSDDQIVNRRIIRISQDKNECLVKDVQSDRLVFVELSKIFVADRFSA